MNAYLSVLKKYAEFSGRSQRQEYWLFVLISTVIVYGLTFVDIATGLFNEETGVGPLSTLYSLGVLVPSIAVAARRLHDTGRSGWWQLLLLIPIIGWIVVIVFLALDSQPGENEYGPNPKGDATPVVS